MSQEIIGNKQFTIEAPQSRVWELLGRAIYRCLPLEQMEVSSHTTFRAVLRWRLAFIAIPLRVKVVLAEISPPNLLAALIEVRKSVINQTMKVTFNLRPLDESKTEVSCRALRDSGGLIAWLMRGQQQRFTGQIFDSISATIRRLC